MRFTEGVCYRLSYSEIKTLFFLMCLVLEISSSYFLPQTVLVCPGYPTHVLLSGEHPGKVPNGSCLWRVQSHVTAAKLTLTLLFCRLEGGKMTVVKVQESWQWCAEEGAAFPAHCRDGWGESMPAPRHPHPSPDGHCCTLSTPGKPWKGAAPIWNLCARCLFTGE